VILILPNNKLSAPSIICNGLTETVKIKIMLTSQQSSRWPDCQLTLPHKKIRPACTSCVYTISAVKREIYVRIITKLHYIKTTHSTSRVILLTSAVKPRPLDLILYTNTIYSNRMLGSKQTALMLQLLCKVLVLLWDVVCLSVVCLWLECIVTKQLQIRRGFHSKVAVETVSMVSLTRNSSRDFYLFE